MSSLCWSESVASHRHAWGTWARLLSIAERLAGRGPLLDIGCGTGQFLRFARDRGFWPLVGIELLPRVARAARELAGAGIVVADLTRTVTRQDHFAVVILWDVLEHVADVRSFLYHARGLLRPGGVAIIGTVHRNGLSLRFLKERALTVAPPEHLTFPTRIGLEEATRASGLTLSHSWSNTVYLREWTRFLPRLRPTDKTDSDYPSWRSHLSSSKLFRFVIAAGNSLLETTRLGDELIAVAQRPDDP